jgi:predicted HTH transcriptional regulator
MKMTFQEIRIIVTGPCVLDQQIINAFKFVKQYNKVSATKEVGRTERPQYSMKAIFEAIVNAVVHPVK